MSLTSLERALPDGDCIPVDTRSLIAYLNGGELVSPAASQIIDRNVRDGRNPAVISIVTVIEVLVRPLRLGVREPYEHLIDFLTHFPNLRPVPIDLVVAQEAASLRAARRLSVPDALVVASGLVAQVGRLVTNDQAWRTRLQAINSRIRVCYLGDHLPFP